MIILYDIKFVAEVNSTVESKTSKKGSLPITKHTYIILIIDNKCLIFTTSKINSRRNFTK